MTDKQHKQTAASIEETQEQNKRDRLINHVGGLRRTAQQMSEKAGGLIALCDSIDDMDTRRKVRETLYVIRNTLSDAHDEALGAGLTSEDYRSTEIEDMTTRSEYARSAKLSQRSLERSSEEMAQAIIGRMR